MPEGLLELEGFVDGLLDGLLDGFADGRRVGKCCVGVEVCLLAGFMDRWTDSPILDTVVGRDVGLPVNLSLGLLDSMVGVDVGL